MSETVGIRYDIQGAQQGAEEVARLKGAVDQLDQTLQQSTQTTEAWEEAASTAGESAGSVAASMEGLGGNARQLVSHMQGLAGQTGSLAAQLGSPGLAAGAHLFGALAGVAQQSMALGEILGPAGALGGAALGLAPILMDLVGANEQVARATSAMTEEQRNFSLEAGRSLEAIDQLIEAQHRLAAETQRRERIDQGLGTVEEQFAAAELAGRRIGTLAVERQHVMEEIHRIQTEDFRDADQLAGLEQRRADLERQIGEAREESHRLGALAVQAQEDERQIATDILEIDQEDARAAAEQSRHRQGAAAARRAEADAARQQREFEQLLTRAGGDGSRSSVERIAHSITEDAGRRDDEAIRRTRQQEQEEIAKRRRAEEQQQERTRRLAEQQEREKTRLAEQHHRERMRQEQEYTSALEQTGNTFGQVFGNAFEKAITGQEDFGKALEEGAKQALLQTGTQMVAEGIGAELTAIGLTVLNPPGAATKAIEGAGKIALGVGLGAAGAAIPAGGSGGGKASAPPVSSSQAQGTGKTAPAINVYMNAPSVIGGTQAQFGRQASQSIRAAQKRFGRDR